VGRVFEDDRTSLVRGLAHITEDCLELGMGVKEFYLHFADQHSLMLVGYMMSETDYSREDCIELIISTLYSGGEDIWLEVEAELSCHEGMLH